MTWLATLTAVVISSTLARSAPHVAFLPPPALVQADLSHPDVVANSIAESQLPPELLNDFYRNPLVASRLAKESWFVNKENRSS